MSHCIRHASRNPCALAVGLAIIAMASATASGRNPYRNNFFSAYPQAVGSRLDDLPSNADHCGVCHFDFDGGGPRNPYGLAVEATDRSVAAILGLGGNDSDADGATNVTEILDPGAEYDNTPTFPGLHAGNVSQVSHVALAEIQDYLTPRGGFDIDPPVVDVVYPDGGESLGSSTQQTIQWTILDASAIITVDVYVSFDGGATYSPLALGMANTGSLDWFVHNRPATQARIRIDAMDEWGNLGSGWSADFFTIFSSAVGRVPTTLRDFDMPGSQPIESGTILEPTDCISCHSTYGQTEVEPYFNWEGGMMAHASIDPLFLAALEIANADAPESGDLCLRCHDNRGWLGGRSTPTDGSQMLPSDKIGVSCDLCHRLVDPIYEPGVSPGDDEAILAALAEVPEQPALGQYVIDPHGTRRGPFDDPMAPHSFLYSPFHRESALCGTCHDVSNPVFVRQPDGSYLPNAFDEPAADFHSDYVGPVERTYSEWFYSAFNTPQGVYAPEFGGNRTYVASCQDCHMRAVTGQGCNLPNAPVRDDLPLHDLTGGSTWMPTILPLINPDINVAALEAGILRALRMLELAADLKAWKAGDQLAVKVINNTGHKLPTGYPEGRRIWLNVKFFDRAGQLLSESGRYDFNTAELFDDAELKIYEIIPVIGADIAPVVGLPAGTEFHFVLNNEIAKDNRIPPLGFTNAAYESFGGAPVGASYADGQNWDVTHYTIPAGAARADVTLYYQSVSREFAEFLRDNSSPGGAGQTFYTLWNDNGKCPPEIMASVTVPFPARVNPSGVSPGGAQSQAEPQPVGP